MIWPFRPRPAVAPALAARARALAPGAVRDASLDDRWVVVDVETGGLDPRVDPLLAIGAVSIANDAIAVAPACEVRLRQREATGSDNILVHGITTGQQLTGVEPTEALLEWLEFAGDSPRIAYHAEFDRLALERAGRDALGVRDRGAWLDLAVLAPLLMPEGPGFNQPLDDWLAHFGIPVYQRHGALADAYATAQLWLALLPPMRARGLSRVTHLMRLCRQVRWLDRRPA